MNLANKEELCDVEHRHKPRRSKSRQVYAKDDVIVEVKKPWKRPRLKIRSAKIKKLM